MDYRKTIQQSLDYIEDNLKTEITAAELADMAGFSLYHYYRLFQAATGLPVMQYILRRRLVHGIYAIHQGSSGIDAALTYGFDTYAGFYKAFLREFACTPSEYLRFSRAKKPCRLNLFQEAHKIMTHKQIKAVLKYWNLETETVSDIYYDGTGTKNENACYVGQNHVLKYSTNLGKLKTHLSLSKEMERIGLWSAAAVPAAGGRETVQVGDLHFCLTKRLPGQQVEALKLYEGDAAGKARFLGKILGQLHLALAQVEACVEEENMLETVTAWALPKAAQVLGLEETACKRYLQTFSALYPQLPRQLIHRDPNPGNIICADNTWGFIDFELSQRNVRLFDPCYAATAVLSETMEHGISMETWLEIYHGILSGYDSVVTLTAEEKQAAPYLVLTNQLICVAWFAEQEKYAQLLERNTAMTKWLADHFEALSLS